MTDDLLPFFTKNITKWSEHGVFMDVITILNHSYPLLTPFFSITHRIHVWNICQHLPQKWPSYVGKYSSTMEHLGLETPPFACPKAVSLPAGSPVSCLRGGPPLRCTWALERGRWWHRGATVHGGCPNRWMVYSWKSQSKMDDDLGVPLISGNQQLVMVNCGYLWLIVVDWWYVCSGEL